MTSQLLNCSDAAAVLMLTPSQVRTLVRKGQLPHVALPNGEIIRLQPLQRAAAHCAACL